MKVSLLVALAALVVLAAAQEPIQRTRSKLRALTEAARNGDPEAQAKLRQLREHRKIIRDREGNPIRRRRPQPNDSNKPAPVTGGRDLPRNIKRIRIPVRKEKQRPVEEPTTFRPTSPQIPVTAAPLEITEILPQPIEVTEPPVEVVNRRPEPVFISAPVESQPQRPVVIRNRPQSSRRPERPVLEHEPHRAINRGLEVDTRSERFNPSLRVIDSTTRKAPVETIRRYSYFDADGAYVFGYEAADGSFKEERRRPDCVVEGKYGYVDPDGVKREFNYISGNQCDPNAPSDPEQQETTIPLNKQFMHQTDERKLTEEELQALHFQRRRKPVTQKGKKPVGQDIQQRRVVSSRRRPAQKAVPQTVIREPQPTVFSRPNEQPIETTPEPHSSRFTTPSSFSQFKNPSIQEEGPVETPAFRPIPIPQTSAPKNSRPRPRPTPVPVSFNFDQEFSSIFKNFATNKNPSPTRPVPRPSPARPITPSRPTTSRPPPPPPTTKPKSNNVLSHFAPATFATSRPVKPTPPATSAPHSSAKPFVDNALTLTAEQPKLLVFDERTRSFKTVKSGAPQQQSFRPLTKPRPSPAPKQTGVPLGIFSQPGRSSPLPSIPQSTAEFDNFFKQFNLQF